MPRVVWSIPSRDDLHHIDEYLMREATPERAVAVLGAIRERLDRPVGVRRLVNQHERAANLRIDERAQPAARLLAGLGDVRADRLHEEDVGEAIHDRLLAGQSRRHLRGDELQGRLEPLHGSATTTFDVDHRRKR